MISAGHRRVKAIKESKEREVEYMKLLERYKEEREEGYKEGLERGLEQGRKEMQRMVVELFQEGSLPAEIAARKLGLKTEEFLSLVGDRCEGNSQGGWRISMV